MSWVALVGPEVEENLSLRYLAAALGQAGVATRILPFNGGGELPRVLRALSEADSAPAVVAISLAFQWRAADCLALVVALREAGFAGHVTGGGHFGTFAAKELLGDFPELDSICRHEAEHTLVALVRAVLDAAPLDGIPGLALRGDSGEVLLTDLPEPPDLATLPWPDRRGEPMRCLGHGVAPIVGSRGCYAECAFCCIASWHRQASGAKRWRVRPVEDVAAEMAHLHQARGIDVFIFHDDDFFVPGRLRARERVVALADALDARGVGPIATVVKARPNDVDPELFRLMRDRLGLNRVFLGVETDSLQGLSTLRRAVKPGTSEQAMQILDSLGIYVCFNMLVFDPDAGLEELEVNLAFMEAHASEPLNFGRVELYAGTPLLVRMQAEGRCRGDYTGWDYDLGTPQMRRVFALFMALFPPRNYAGDALANRLMGTRFDVEVARTFHPEHFEPGWLDEAKRLSRTLTGDSVAVMRELVASVRGGGEGEAALTTRLRARMRGVEAQVRRDATRLEETVQKAVGRRCAHGRPVEWAA